MDEDITNSNLKDDAVDLPLEDVTSLSPSLSHADAGQAGGVSSEEGLNGILEEELAVAKDSESDLPMREEDVDHLELEVAKKPEVKKKPKFLPWLIIIPVLILMLLLGIVYWMASRADTGDNNGGNEEETEENGNGNTEETETPVETEKPEIDFTEISDGLRELDDAVSDIDETLVLIDESVNLNDDVPEL